MTGCTIHCATATCYRTNYYKYQAPNSGSSLLFFRPVRPHKLPSPFSASVSTTSSYNQPQAPADFQSVCTMFSGSFEPPRLFGSWSQLTCSPRQLRPNCSQASGRYCYFEHWHQQDHWLVDDHSTYLHYAIVLLIYSTLSADPVLPSRFKRLCQSLTHPQLWLWHQHYFDLYFWALVSIPVLPINTGAYTWSCVVCIKWARSDCSSSSWYMDLYLELAILP